MQDNAALVWCPFPSEESARAISNQLLDEKLIACANIIGSSQSIFDWNGQRDKADETPVLFKTTASQCNKLVLRLGDIHPYDTPAIMGWDCKYTHPKTLAWLDEQLKQE